MSQPSDPKTNLPASEDLRARAEDHGTVLLSGTPNAPTAPPPPAVHLSPAVISALSQRYDLLAEAGHGSMGNVYKARDRETGETVALKLLKPEIASDQAMMERFKNELLFARKITHKNVCRVYDFNRLGGIICTSMEFVTGENLRAVLQRAKGRPLRNALDLVFQICAGLKEAHAQGIVHRDLKPENIMIDTQGSVKIMDFGIARSMEAGTQHTGSMVGTPAYMAPEQASGKPVDYRTDIYALGLIMYEMFTGKPAFQAENAVSLAVKQVREEPVEPHDLEPSISMPLENAILRCLEKEPARRFQSVAQLEEALRPSPVTTAAAPPLKPAAAPSASPSHPSPNVEAIHFKPAATSKFGAADGNKLDPFKPQQPVIPGVSSAKPAPKPVSQPAAAPPLHRVPEVESRGPNKRVGLAILGVLVAVIFVAGVLYWSHGTSSTSQQAAADSSDGSISSVTSTKKDPGESLPVAPGPVARAGELANAWSSKRFVFHDPLTSDSVPAMLVRLPQGEYWAFSLREPYGTCELEYVTDLQKLASEYNFTADHPMVTNPCKHTVYDLARYGGGATNGGLVRGAIVEGPGIRPPMAIKIRVGAREIVAEQIE